jgi:hypothetical protein
MRCTHCDLPLSPTSTARVCPRCHMPTITGANAAAKSKQTPVVQSPSWGDSAAPLTWQENSGAFAGVPPNSGLWNTNFSAMQSGRIDSSQQSAFPDQSLHSSPGRTSGTHNIQRQNPAMSNNDRVQLSFPASQQAPYPQPGQMWPPTPPTPSPLLTVSSPQLSAGELRWESQPLPQTSDSRWASRPLPQTSEVHMHKTRTATSNLGFIIASVCVITGGLLLILVYFIAAGLPPSTTQTQSITTGSPVVTATPHSTPTAVVPTPTPKPTPTASIGAFPAQQFIANPQMASAVNMTTAQVIQPATTFRVGQRVYVTFAIHPDSRSGAVCLLWYSNARTFSHFEFAVSSNSTVAYSYTYYATSGPAYVEIYWASDISCSDKMLAQRVNFTVN